MARPYFLEFMSRVEADNAIDYNDKARFQIPEGELLVTDCTEYDKIIQADKAAKESEEDEFDDSEEDEFDDEDLMYSKLDANNYVFEGKTALKDFYKIIKVENDEDFENNKGEAETIAGFVLKISGCFPKLNSKINFKNYTFTIEALDKKRIKLVKFTIL